ncbi:hypothetical protein [Kineosporia sp. NBRC 101731]|uniref:hypothetical protein n=1 Tax=Kineosporia sp. NBRC 101731 TaxID=3032199 RepID=UPI0024A5A912|nr:hypothetical protein [Kineosporia sp. NBRC 101731]GLY32496.1 hypothetical protein Kisp02_58610 [Kineosporia sp. NBRC 101731]
MAFRSAGAAAGALCLSFALIACNGQGSTETQSCQPASPTAHPTSAPEGHDVKVVESGFTTVAGKTNAAFPVISMGAVLENPSDQVAYRTRVTFDAQDVRGSSVILDTQSRYSMIEVPVIQPGEKVAVGVSLIADERSTATTISVTPDLSTWLPSGDSSNGLAPVVATLVPENTDHDTDGSAHLQYTVANTNCDNLIYRGVSVVWRDADGTLVGGDTDTARSSFPCNIDSSDKAFRADTKENSTPESVDFSKSDVTVFCDVNRRSEAPGAGKPIN